MTLQLALFIVVLLTSLGAGGGAWRAIAALTGCEWIAPLQAGMVRLAWIALPAAGLCAAVTLLMAAETLAGLAHASVAGVVLRTAAVFVAWVACNAGAARYPGPALIVWLCACSVFATDWVAAPHGWRSTVIGMSLGLAQLTLSFAVGLCLGVRAASPRMRRDLAGLVVVLALGWLYLAGVDYLTAWIADLPDETRWYLPRTRGPWGTWIATSACLALLVPVGVFLRAVARERVFAHRLAAVSLVLGQAGYLAWLVLP